MEAPALPAEQPALDGLPGEVVVEAEDVGVGLDEQAAVDGGAQVVDQLGLRRCRSPRRAGRTAPGGRAPTRPRRRRAPPGRARRAGCARARRWSTAAVPSSSPSPPRSPALATSSSRKNGLPPVRRVERVDGAERRVLLEHGGEERAHVGRAEAVEVDVGHRVAALEARQQVGGGVAAARGRRAGRCRPGRAVRRRARRGARTAARLSESAQWRSSNTTQGRRPAVSWRTRSTPARTRSSDGRLGSGRRRRSSAWPLTSARRATSRNSSIGRPTVPGSAWPASTSVPGGHAGDRAPARAGSCRCRPRRRSVRPTGTDEAPTQGAQPVQLGRSTDHHR